MFLPHNDELRIPYEATNFPEMSGLNRSDDLEVVWADLLWATMTVGKTRRDVLRHGRYSLADFLHRIACIYAYYDIKDGHVVRSPAFSTLDPSEKAIASFYLGMAMAKLYAEKVLKIPWLMHISRYEASWSLKYGASRKRPDLFGCNAAGDWAVVEAKGRDRVTGALVTKMQGQKSSVATINGAAPAHRIGAATRFEGGQLALRVVDPPAGRGAQEVPIDPTAWLRDYYTPIVDLIADGDHQVEEGYLIGVIPSTDISVGLSDEIVAWVDESRQRPFQRPAPRRADAELDEMQTVHRRLVEQTRAEDRPALERITSVDRPSNLRGAFRDGVLIRAPW